MRTIGYEIAAGWLEKQELAVRKMYIFQEIPITVR
jgi:hypothetical protein